MMDGNFKTVEEYISTFPDEIQKLLSKIRETILENAPKATEHLAYGMPAYKINGKPLVYFGGFKNHIGFYATPTGHKKFADVLSKYKSGKGSVQFPFDEPIPYDLIVKIVQFRVTENQQKL